MTREQLKVATSIKFAFTKGPAAMDLKEANTEAFETVHYNAASNLVTALGLDGQEEIDRFFTACGVEEV